MIKKFKNIETKFVNKDRKKIYFNSGAGTLVLKDTLEKFNFELENNLYSSSDGGNIDLRENIGETRNLIRDIFNVKRHDIIFQSNTTSSINLVAYNLNKILKKGDEIILTDTEHLSNFSPWIKFAKEYKIKVNIIETDKGLINIKNLKSKISKKTKLISFNHLSNTFSLENNISEIINLCKDLNIYSFVDAAQSFSKVEIDFSKIDPDFLVISAQKAFGIDSFGVLLARKEIINNFEPLIIGGKMNKGLDKMNNLIYANSPYKFEAGSKSVSNISSFSKSLEFISELDLEKVKLYLIELSNYCKDKLSNISNIDIINNNVDSIGTVLIRDKNYSSQDLYYYLEQNNIFTTQGFICSNNNNPNINNEKFLRISFHIYNSKEQIDKLYNVLNNGGNYLDENI